MINLLPPTLKESYSYGRRNRSLRRWLSAALLAIAGALVLAGGGFLYMHIETANLNEQVASSAALLQKEHLPTVQKQVTDISNNLKLTEQVLSKEILFSQLLKQLAKVTPSNVALTDLAISQTQGAIDITAQTASYSAATQLQLNLADPANQIFSTADIVSITCAANPIDPSYPCTAVLRALFGVNNPFLFINSGKKTP